MQQVARQYTVMVPETQTKMVSCTVYKPVYSTRTCQYQVQVPEYSVVDQPYTCSVPMYSCEDRTYTVMVPHYEQRTGVRKVCRVVPVQTMQTVACDEGHWETCVQEVRCCRRGCAGTCCCGSRTICRKVWVPQIVTKEVPVTSCQTVVEDQPYAYTVVVCRPEVRTCKVRVCHVTTETRVRKVQVCHYRTELRTKTYQVCEMVPEVRTRPVTYTVCVPQVQTRICQETSYRIEPVQRVVTYTVCVPRQVQKVVCEPVCRMVQKTVLVPARCCCN
jgi:hypothetical protein